MGYFKMKGVPVSVSVSIANWLRKHGHAVPPSLTKQERGQLAECFKLMDGDGSGAIDVDELYSAFKILGLHVTKKSVSELLAHVDADGSGEVELPEFIQIMSKTREIEQEASFWGYDAPKPKTKGDDAMPLHYLTAAYRRKHTLDTVMDPTLRLVYAPPPGAAGSQLTAAQQEARNEEPAIDLSATFRQSMRLNTTAPLAGTPAKDDVGALFRSLAADSFSSEPDHRRYKRRTQSDHLLRREQIEEGVRARFASEEADVQRIAEQRQWLETKGGRKQSWQSKKQGSLQHESSLSLDPGRSDLSHSKEEDSGMLGEADQVDCAGPDSVADSNKLSVTMLLRRSPELDVATLGGMNLVSSTTLQQPTTPPSRCQSPQHVVSNQTCPSAAEHIAFRAHPQGRNAVMPHVIHLRDVHGHSAHENRDTDLDHGRLAGTLQPWHSAQHGSSAQHSMQHMPQHAQRTKPSSSMHAQSSNSHPRRHAHTDSSPEGAVFDLYHHSQKLAEQLPAELKVEESNDISGASAAFSHGRRSPGSRASSISPAGALVTGGAYSIQGPALDTDPEAADAAAVFAETQSSGSIQPLALDTELSIKSSTVRFKLAGSDPSNDPSAPSSAHVPTELEDEHGGHAALQSEDVEGAVPHGPRELWASNKRTLSLSSTGPSLKGVLKKSMSRDCAVVAPYGTSPALESSGVSFALGAEEDSIDEDLVSCMPSSALLKQGSESFPAWLTGGDDTLSMPAARDDESGAEVGCSFLSECVGKTATFVDDYEDHKYQAHTQPGLKAPIDTSQGEYSFQEKRTRMIAQPTAVQISARLLAIKQIATCC